MQSRLLTTLKKEAFENVLGKGKKCWLSAFSLFPKCLLSQNKLLSFNPFPNKPWFLRVCCASLLKTLWEKEKLLVTSNFSFSRSVFYPFGELSVIFIRFKIVVCKLFQFQRVQNLSFGKGLSHIYFDVCKCFRVLSGKESSLHHTIASFSDPVKEAF